MKKLLLILVLSILVIASCKKSSPVAPASVCINNLLEPNRNNPNWEIGSIDEYDLKGKTIYGLSQDGNIINDGGIILVDENCNSLCFVGGFAGYGNANCLGVNFFKESKLIRNIWSK